MLKKGEGPKRETFGRWFIFALVFRLLLLPVYHHEDADSFFYWAKYLWEKKDFLFFLGKSVPNAVRANYPPVFYYLMFFWRGVYEFFGRFLWWLNINISFFPSNLIFWYQSYTIGIAFNKIPAVLADLGCAVLICKIIGEISKSTAVNIKLKKTAIILFLFLPVTWYNSAVWGQIESIYALFLLLGFYLVMKNRFLIGTFAIMVSFLIKPIGLVVLPVFVVYLFKKRKILDFVIGVASALILSFILFFPFYPLDTLVRAADFYVGNFRGPLNNIANNAFNFWGLIFGFENLPSAEFQVLHLSLSFWGQIIFFSFLIFICYRIWKRSTKEVFFLASFLTTFSAFLFLPRMHERYFYPSLIFLAVLGGLKKRWFNSFIILSLVHFLNLYHFWWYPRIPFLISMLSNLFFIRFIILISLVLFGFSLYKLFIHEPFDNNS